MKALEKGGGGGGSPPPPDSGTHTGLQGYPFRFAGTPPPIPVIPQKGYFLIMMLLCAKHSLIEMGGGGGGGGGRGVLLQENLTIRCSLINSGESPGSNKTMK